METISMDKLLFAIICSPFCAVATLLNIFFFFCLNMPAAGVNLHQPLQFLLMVQICNYTLQQFIVLISIVLAFLSTPDGLLVVNVALTFQTYCSNFATSAWISIVYYMKIVPQHWPFFVWIKKNIKATVFTGFIFNQILLLAALTMGAMSYLDLTPVGTNSTATHQNTTAVTGAVVENEPLLILATRVFVLYLSFPIISLVITWGRTFVYLRAHIKRMEETTGSSSSAQHKNQMRVTVMGIVQTALFVPSSLWVMFLAVMFGTPLYQVVDYDKHISMTFMSISGLANIVCLGFSQSVFRLRVIPIVRRIKKVFGLKDQAEQS